MMKKLFALLLAAVMALSLVACGGNDTKNDQPSGDQPAEITSALNLLETVWNDYGEDEKFAVVGGGPDAEQMVENAPGAFDLTDRSLAEYQLVLPEAADINFFSAPEQVKAQFRTLPATLAQAKAAAENSSFINQLLPQTIISYYTR